MPNPTQHLRDTLAGVLERAADLPPLTVAAVAVAYDALVDPTHLPSPPTAPVPAGDVARALEEARQAAISGISGGAADPLPLALAARHLRVARDELGGG